ncbi:MAG: energy-dependent translational throttle protein EttA [Bacteroidota bacterium]
MTDRQIIFSMTGVSKTLNTGKTILKDIYLSFYYGAKIGVLGLNGAGKSTLLKIIAGEDKNYSGDVVFNQNFKIGYLHQEPKLDESKTVMEIVKEGVQHFVDTLTEYDEINEKFGLPEYYEDGDKMDQLLRRQGELQDVIDGNNLWELDNRLEKAMDALRCPAPETPIAILSGGERRRVALCRLLLSNPDILLLDEPTNHLDAESVHWLEQFLASFPGTVIAVTHDRYFLDNVAGWILELDRGEGIPYQGNYTSWLEQKMKRLAQEEKQESKRQKALERELEWVRMAPKARQAKSKARLSAYDKMASEESREKEQKLELYIPPGPRLGDVVLQFDGVSKKYGDRVLFENLNFNIPKGAIVGVVGPNGMGKTTLFKMIMDLENPDSGDITRGETVSISYVDQSHKDLDTEKSVYDVVSQGLDNVTVGNFVMNSRAYLGRFNFSGNDQSKKVGVLSGGERNRLHLAMTLKEGGNVLLLDEPTNDIDVNTLRALEEGIENFAGCVVVISHDRWFIDRIATHILAYEGDGQVVFFEGNYSDYEESAKERMGESKKSRFKNIN